MLKTTAYKATLEYLYSALPMYQRIGAAAFKNDLTNTLVLCEALGNPERKFKSIHIAGTNGKGSTSHMLAAILQSAGYKTGLYTSPHLKEFTERIKINGLEIEEQYIVDFVSRIKPVIEKISPSFFEMTVAMAYDYFASKKIDVAVIEVGLGGRLDSTNVITPLLSIITNISFDHKDMLGDTLPKIAFEKAGIIKRNVPVVISERQPEVEEVFLSRASQLDAPLTFASDQVQFQGKETGFDVYQGGRLWLEDLAPELRGDYQKKNLPGVLQAVVELRNLGFDISDRAIHKGVSSVVELTGLKGRWQKLGESPLVICDTGHNEAGLKEVMEQIARTPYKKLHIVFGVVKGKELEGVLALLPASASYYFCQAKIPRAMEAAELHALAARKGLQGKVIPDVRAALKEARANAGPSDLVFIGGSTFVVAEIEGL